MHTVYGDTEIVFAICTIVCAVFTILSAYIISLYSTRYSIATCVSLIHYITVSILGLLLLLLMLLDGL